MYGESIKNNESLSCDGSKPGSAGNDFTSGWPSDFARSWEKLWNGFLYALFIL
jgi:hypothetical protein